MPNYFLDLPADTLALPADGAEIDIPAGAKLRRHDGAIPCTIVRGPGARAVFVSEAPVMETVPVLTAGSIDQTAPAIGATLMVSGCNASGTASYQWQVSADGSTGWTDLAGATKADLDTSSGVTGGTYLRRSVSDGAQGPLYTSALRVTVVAPTYITESFAYPDGDLVAVSGGTWAYLRNTRGQGLRVVDGMVRPDGEDGYVYCSYEAAAPTANQYAEVAIDTYNAGTGRRMYLVLRALDTDNYYYLTASNAATDTLAIFKSVDGTITDISGDVSWTIGSVPGTLRFEAIGTTLRALWNGNEVISVKDADLATGKIGFGMNNANIYHHAMRVSDFAGGTL